MLKTNGFRYEFTGKELFYFLFKKKICPKCGGKLIKSKYTETVDGAKFDTVSAPLYIKGREIKQYYYLFLCEKCNSEFTLNELANK